MHSLTTRETFFLVFYSQNIHTSIEGCICPDQTVFGVLIISDWVSFFAPGQARCSFFTAIGHSLFLKKIKHIFLLLGFRWINIDGDGLFEQCSHKQSPSFTMTRCYLFNFFHLFLFSRGRGSGWGWGVWWRKVMSFKRRRNYGNC